MNLVEEAMIFAINAHDGQVRKVDTEKPAVVHPINVANILKEYGFDEEVIAAGYLHDVLEDTKYVDSDIERLFGSNVLSLVKCASEPDKSLSWEDRKQHTIHFTKDLDIRHKAVICADKISNMEDLMISSEINGECFSKLKRGFESNKWYYEGVYNSLINEQDKNHPLFVRLKQLIDHVFYNEKDDEYIKNVIFKDNDYEYKELSILHYKKKELLKLRSINDNKEPYVIEFTGTPRTGKTNLINNLNDFFKKGGFDIKVLEEFTTSNYFKNDIYPSLKDKSLYEKNTYIPKYVKLQLDEAISKDPDIIIGDRSLLDRLVWINRLYIRKEITKDQYYDYKELYVPIIRDNIDIIIGTYTDSLTSIKRDYGIHLSLEKRKHLYEEYVNEYNEALFNIEDLCHEEDINLHLFDTTNTSEREISFGVSNQILEDMRVNDIDNIKRMVLRNSNNK
ncbi:MAG: HD domain-containing protein [Tenericutes bacterium]|nr:HD domain-containing protein [Mycoplasmatota bacterium]